VASFIFGSDRIERETRDDVKSLFYERTGEKPAVYENNEVFLLSSRDNIDQGSVKVAFNGYIVDSKTEPEQYIAEAYNKYGKDFVKHLDGQFRFILYDTEKERLQTSADKAGRKVVYYSDAFNGFVCSSHLAPLLRHSSIRAEPNPVGISDFLQGWSASFGGGHRLIKDVFRVYPSQNIIYTGEKTVKEQFWDVGQKKQNISDEKAVKKMDQLLTEGAEKLVEQVEGSLNVFLSGGFDSTFLVALLREVTDRDINTYTWGWEDEHFQSGREMSEMYGTQHTDIRNDYSFPSDEEVYFYEEPQNAFVRYPFREMYKEHDIRSFWTGLNSQATFPVCLKNIRKLDYARFSAPMLRRIPTRRLKQGVSKLDYRLGKAIEVLESEHQSTSAVIDWSVRKDETKRIRSKKLKKHDRDLDAALDQKWQIPDQSYQEGYNYLQLRTRDTARYAYYAQDLEHYDIYGYRPLVEFSYSLPISQKKNRRLLQKIAEGRVPNRIITKGASGWDFVSEQFRKTIESNEEDYRRTIDRFIDRGLVDRQAAEEYLLPSDFNKGRGRVNQMMAVYLLERWMKVFIDREEPWKDI
jgi:hypothetical protein